MKKKNNDIIRKIEKLYNKFSSWIPPKLYTFFLISCTLIFIAMFSFTLDNDFWFLINTGKYILNNGIPTIEPFTMHVGLEFVAQQWLTDIIFFSIYDLFDIYGLFIFSILLLSIIAYLVYKLSKILSDNIKLSSFITIIFIICFGLSFFRTRPQLFDTMFFLLEFILLELYIKTNNKKYLIGLPIVSLLMINLHSSLWLIMFIFLLPYYAEKILFRKKIKYEIKPIIIATILMFIAGLINPYGIKAITYLFNSFGINEINNFIAEMGPTNIKNGFLLFIYVGIVFYSYYYNKGNNKARYLFLMLGTLYLGLSHIKGMLYFLVSTIPALAYNFKNIFKEKGKQDSFYKGKVNNIIIIVTLILYATIFGYNYFNTSIKTHMKPALYEVGEYLLQNVSKDSKIYTNYNDGGYIELLGYKCYIDPRAEVFLKANNKKEDIFIEYYYLNNRKIDYRDFLDKYNFDYLIVYSKEDLYYDLEYVDDYIVVFEQKINEYDYRIYKKA